MVISDNVRQASTKESDREQRKHLMSIHMHHSAVLCTAEDQSVGFRALTSSAADVQPTLYVQLDSMQPH
jgi:hypothetical protein